ncbi:hypothetical protein GF343_03730 [Candidatus Woesearchaeota archaeon]|nr:hypothetical protein [Candidatus Woesearchaeota archaeon]
MTKGLKTSNPSVKPTVGELEQTAQRLAGEFNIALSETDTSGISYEKELEGRNGEVALTYFKDIHADYERIEVERQGSRFSMIDRQGDYLVIINAYGRNLLDALKKKPHKEGVEAKLLAGIANNLVTLKKQPEEQHEICADIDKAELSSISSKTIDKYLS